MTPAPFKAGTASSSSLPVTRPRWKRRRGSTPCRARAQKRRERHDSRRKTRLLIVVDTASMRRGSNVQRGDDEMTKCEMIFAMVGLADVIMTLKLVWLFM
jgi:hypothetical protein